MSSFSILPIILFTCVCFFILRARRSIFMPFAWVAFGLLFLYALYFFTSKLLLAISHPQVFDFTAFYIWGKAAATGQDFYSPAVLQHIFTATDLPPADYEIFKTEIVNVGFFYPPPTMFYFVLLGFFSFKTALVGWTVLHALLAAACIYMLWDAFLRTDRWKGIMLVTILFAFLEPVFSTVLYGQTNFLLLLYVLLIHKYAGKPVAGIFVAIAMFTKPYMVILVLIFIIRRQWKTVAWFVFSSAIITGISAAVFGLPVFKSYIFDNVSHRIPDFVYTEGINQSMHAVLLRKNVIDSRQPLSYSIIMLGFIGLAVLYLRFLAGRRFYDYVLAVLLLVGLIAYPGTLSYYGVLLLFIVFQFFDKRSHLSLNPILAAPVIAIIYYLCTFSVFSAICFLLAVLLIHSIVQLNRPEGETLHSEYRG